MFDNTESVVIQSKKEISMEGIDCIFGSLGDIRYMYREPQKKKKNQITWICYTAHSMAMRAVEIDNEVVGGAKIKVEPAQYYIRDHQASKGKIPEKSSSYSYSDDYSTDTDADNSQLEDDIPIYSMKPITTPTTIQDQWPERFEQKQQDESQKQKDSKHKKKGDRKNKRKRRSQYSSDYSSSSYSYSSYSDYSSYSSYSDYSYSTYESEDSDAPPPPPPPPQKRRHHNSKKRH